MKFIRFEFDEAEDLDTITRELAGALENVFGYVPRIEFQDFNENGTIREQRILLSGNKESD